MKIEEKDILADKSLREMPFSTPEGYFENFKVAVPSDDQAQGGPVPFYRKLTPYLAMAAMFLMIFGAGSFFTHIVNRSQPVGTESTYEYGDLAWIDIIPVTDQDAIFYTDAYSNDISDEDIIEYLFSEGIDPTYFY